MQLQRVADELVAEAEGVKAIGRDGAVTKPRDNLLEDCLELLMQLVERLDRLGVLDLLADLEQRQRQPAGLLRRNAREGRVETDEDRTNDAQGGEADIKQVAIAFEKRFC